MLQIGCCCGEGPSCQDALTCTGFPDEHIEALMCCGQRAEITVPALMGDGQYDLVTYETSFINITHIVNGHYGGTWFNDSDGVNYPPNYTRGLSQPPSSANCRVHFRKVFNSSGGYVWKLFGYFGNWQFDDTIFNDASGFRPDLWEHFRLNSGSVSCGNFQERETQGGDGPWQGYQEGCCCECVDCLPYSTPIGCQPPCQGDGGDGTSCECGCAVICPPVCFENGCPGSEFCEDDGPDCTCGTHITSTVRDYAPTDRGVVSATIITALFNSVGNNTLLGNRPHPDWGAEEDMLHSWRGWGATKGGSFASCPGPDVSSGYSRALNVVVSYISRLPGGSEYQVAATSTVHSNCLNAFEQDHPCVQTCWTGSVFGAAIYGTPYKSTYSCFYDLSCVENAPDYCASVCACPCDCFQRMGGMLDGYSAGSTCADRALSEVCDCGGGPECSGGYVTCSHVISYPPIPPVSGLIS